MNYVAHTKDGKTFTSEEECQSLKEHLENTSCYAKKRAEAFDAGDIAKTIGLLHDIGKYSDSFQERIRGKNISAPHAMSGAYLLSENYKNDAFAKYYGIIIGSHHTGLSDWGTVADNDNDTYLGKLHNHTPTILPYETEITLPKKIAPISIKRQRDYLAFQFATHLRMLYSTLVDSDFTDTEEFCSGVSREVGYPAVDELLNCLMAKMPKGKGNINKIRSDILSSCISAADKPQGLFTLTVPTGGGKTLSSLAFALKHAQEHELRRVIYVIPYTSIIEQNAEVFRNKFKETGYECVLEHHSGVDIDSTDFKARWASENWDIPIVVTTNVQFFESLFSGKTKSVRKLHNIAKSVVIFDEAQMLPTDYLTPCMAIVSELILNYGVTAVLCSATQPIVQKYIYPGIDTTEIADNPDELSELLKRVDYRYDGKKTDEEIVSELKSRQSALVIVNSRRHAFSLYALAEQEINEGLFYLSTLLTPADRSSKIATIKKRLDQELPTRVISTQLIEAGVDMDFPVVYRSIAGIDSIIQAGGRANREGKMPQPGEVIVFEPCGEGVIPRAIENTAKIGREVILSMGDEAFGLGGVKKYFELLYSSLERDKTMDKKKIMSEFTADKFGIIDMNFDKAARKFKLIDDNTYGIIIENNNSKKLIKSIRSGDYSRETLRKLQKYTVSVYSNEYIQLKKDNALGDEMLEGMRLLATKSYYSSDNGLDIFTGENKYGQADIL